MTNYTFCIHNESHTLGNMLSSFINDNELSQFASYRVPHPLCEDVHVTIQAKTSSEAATILMSACDATRNHLEQALAQIDSDPPPVLAVPDNKFDISVFQGDTIRNGDMK